VGHDRRYAAGARGGGRYCDFAGRDGIPASGNLIAGNLNVAKAMVDAIGTNATPTRLKT
jgi:myo-inositol-1(or 4)-monophosphatase